MMKKYLMGICMVGIVLFVSLILNVASIVSPRDIQFGLPTGQTITAIDDWEARV